MGIFGAIVIVVRDGVLTQLRACCRLFWRECREVAVGVLNCRPPTVTLRAAHPYKVHSE